MSITSLPQATIRTIGSAQALTTPDSFVKELIDNALDARATGVFVEIAANTIDILQVRDNGHGVAPGDRDLVCKRYCTSKIKDQNDLLTIGGSSLGFRGDALASAAELSGGLLMTTRVEGESVAVGLRISRNKDAAGREKASHPVGTTVRITDIYNKIPVRKQTATKNAQKCLTKIKHLMQAYAMARPSVRFSLRVLKAKNEKGNWVYAPKPGSGIEDAAFKIVGKDCASQCHSSVMEYEGFEVQAFLPRTDAEPLKISGVGHFFSVDSRPVSTSRGTMKDILKLFRERLRAPNTSFADVKDPFLWLNIMCPPSSYDANVEPAKDDVLFEDSDKVLQAARTLFETCYPASMLSPRTGNFNRGEPIHVYEDSELADEPPSKRRRIQLRLSSIGGDDVHETASERSFVEQAPNVLDAEADTASSLRDINVSNPWIMAKMNTIISPKQSPVRPSMRPSSPFHQQSDSDLNVSLPFSSNIPPFSPWAGLPTPAHTSSPLRERERPKVHDSEALLDQSSHETNIRPAPARTAGGWTSHNNNDFIPARALPFSSQLSLPPRDIRESSTASSTTTFDRPANRRPSPPVRNRSPQCQQAIEHITTLVSPQHRQSRLVRHPHDRQNGWLAPEAADAPARPSIRRRGGGAQLHPLRDHEQVDGDIRASLTSFEPRVDRLRRVPVSGPHRERARNDDDDVEDDESVCTAGAPSARRPRMEDFNDPTPVFNRGIADEKEATKMSLLQGVSTTLAIRNANSLQRALGNVYDYPDLPPYAHYEGDDEQEEEIDIKKEDEPPSSSLWNPHPEREEVEGWQARIEMLLLSCR